MLDRKIFELEYIQELQKRYGRDPLLLERALFAFGLLEALERVGMPFIFKGGTSLLLLLKKPMRLSTDIDIIVEPGTDVDYFINEANKLFPFNSSEEQIRVGKNNIEKRHFKFYYDSPLKATDFHVFLDILFEKNNYSKTEEREINNALLEVMAPQVLVKVPSLNCILGDKLTAFAPHTTGVGFEKSLEVIKQLFDVAILIDEMTDFDEVKQTYKKIAKAEIEYRGLEVSQGEVLLDTIQACSCVIGRGSILSEEYALYLSGISRITNHIFNVRYSGELAALDACKVMCLAACILTDQQKMIKIDNPEIYIDEKISVKEYSKLSYIKKMKLEAYGYLVEAIKILEKMN